MREFNIAFIVFILLAHGGFALRAPCPRGGFVTNIVFDGSPQVSGQKNRHNLLGWGRTRHYANIKPSPWAPRSSLWATCPVRESDKPLSMVSPSSLQEELLQSPLQGPTTSPPEPKTTIAPPVENKLPSSPQPEVKATLPIEDKISKGTTAPPLEDKLLQSKPEATKALSLDEKPPSSPSPPPEVKATPSIEDKVSKGTTSPPLEDKLPQMKPEASKAPPLEDKLSSSQQPEVKAASPLEDKVPQAKVGPPEVKPTPSIEDKVSKVTTTAPVEDKLSTSLPSEVKATPAVEDKMPKSISQEATSPPPQPEVSKAPPLENKLSSPSSEVKATSPLEDEVGKVTTSPPLEDKVPQPKLEVTKSPLEEKISSSPPPEVKATPSIEEKVLKTTTTPPVEDKIPKPTLQEATPPPPQPEVSKAPPLADKLSSPPPEIKAAPPLEEKVFKIPSQEATPPLPQPKVTTAPQLEDKLSQMKPEVTKMPSLENKLSSSAPLPEVKATPPINEIPKPPTDAMTTSPLQQKMTTSLPPPEAKLPHTPLPEATLHPPQSLPEATLTTPPPDATAGFGKIQQVTGDFFDLPAQLQHLFHDVLRVEEFGVVYATVATLAAIGFGVTKIVARRNEGDIKKDSVVNNSQQRGSSKFSLSDERKMESKSATNLPYFTFMDDVSENMTAPAVEGQANYPTMGPGIMSSDGSPTMNGGAGKTASGTSDEFVNGWRGGTEKKPSGTTDEFVNGWRSETGKKPSGTTDGFVNGWRSETGKKPSGTTDGSVNGWRSGTGKKPSETTDEFVNGWLNRAASKERADEETKRRRRVWAEAKAKAKKEPWAAGRTAVNFSNISKERKQVNNDVTTSPGVRLKGGNAALTNKAKLASEQMARERAENEAAVQKRRAAEAKAEEVRRLNMKAIAERKAREAAEFKAKTNAEYEARLEQRKVAQAKAEENARLRAEAEAKALIKKKASLAALPGTRLSEVQKVQKQPSFSDIPKRVDIDTKMNPGIIVLSESSASKFTEKNRSALQARSGRVMNETRARLIAQSEENARKKKEAQMRNADGNTSQGIMYLPSPDFSSVNGKLDSIVPRDRADPKRMTVKLPLDSVPGKQIKISHPLYPNKSVDVMVPEGASPGETVMIQITDSDGVRLYRSGNPNTVGRYPFRVD